MPIIGTETNSVLYMHKVATVGLYGRYSVTMIIVQMKLEKACQNRILKQNRYVIFWWVNLNLQITKSAKVYKVKSG